MYISQTEESPFFICTSSVGSFIISSDIADYYKNSTSFLFNIISYSPFLVIYYFSIDLISLSLM